jgi:hypothetical protein
VQVIAAENTRRVVTVLPKGWRIIETPIQWIVQRPLNSVTTPWKPVAFHIERDVMIRQLPERLWGPRSGKVLSDEVLVTLRVQDQTIFSSYQPRPVGVEFRGYVIERYATRGGEERQSLGVTASAAAQKTAATPLQWGERK